jgi:hypothetical protein
MLRAVSAMGHSRISVNRGSIDRPVGTLVIHDQSGSGGAQRHPVSGRHGAPNASLSRRRRRSPPSYRSSGAAVRDLRFGPRAWNRGWALRATYKTCSRFSRYPAACSECHRGCGRRTPTDQLLGGASSRTRRETRAPGSCRIRRVRRQRPLPARADRYSSAELSSIRPR